MTDKNYWENTGYSLGNGEYYKIEFFYAKYVPFLLGDDNFDRNYDIFFSFVDIVTGKKDDNFLSHTFSSHGAYKGFFYSIFKKRTMG